MPLPSYRIIDHTADIGFATTAQTLPLLFENAALVLFDLMWQTSVTEQDQEVAVNVTGGDLEELMVNFLEEFLYLYDARELVMNRIRIDSAGPDGIKGRAWGHPLIPGQDREILGVKAITYHQLLVGPTDGGWEARVLLDV